MRAWIEPDPDYQESNAYLEIETYEQGQFVSGSYYNSRRLKWHLEIDDLGDNNG